MVKKSEEYGLKTRWLIVIALFLTYLSKTSLLYVCNTFLPVIKEELQMTGAQQGLFASFNSLFQLAMAFLTATISTKLGSKKCFALGLSFNLFAAIAYSVGTFPMLLLGKAFYGICGGMTIVFTASTLKTVFGKNNQQTAVMCAGVIGCGAFLARFLTMATAYPLSEMLGGWRPVFWVFGALTLVAIVLWLIAYPSDEEYQGRNREVKGLGETLKNWATVLKNATVRKFVAYYFCSGLSGTVVNAFMVTYLVTVRGMEASVASGMSSYSGLFGIAGALLGSQVASRLGVKKIIIPAEVMSGVLVLTLSLMPTSMLTPAVFICLFGLHGFCNAAQSQNNMGLLIKQKSLTQAEVTTASSAVMGIFYLGQYLSSQIFGIVYPIVGMNIAFPIWGCFVFIGAVIVMTIKEPGKED